MSGVLGVYLMLSWPVLVMAASLHYYHVCIFVGIHDVGYSPFFYEYRLQECLSISELRLTNEASYTAR